MATRTTKKPKTPEPNAIPPTGEVLTLAEAAAFLRVSESGLKADAAAGRVPGRVVAGEWRFVKPTLLAWLSQPEARPVPCPTGAELVEHIRRTGVPWGPESEREAEAFIAANEASRKARPAGG